ncbi:hypothetical protein [Aeromicrobium duanguangcaii]|uniref:hypothetical protein n=1 Tax=Aeromicrobium duanguangcaii TaxID=2968086 RepID=UPI0020180BA8|nr:hypothetical protein [Aeromicrobium duanguangcaii]MCL3838009.1 hypothetical protein [Aeromicrobium duanguangcaii]
MSLDDWTDLDERHEPHPDSAAFKAAEYIATLLSPLSTHHFRGRAQARLTNSLFSGDEEMLSHCAAVTTLLILGLPDSDHWRKDRSFPPGAHLVFDIPGWPGASAGLLLDEHPTRPEDQFATEWLNNSVNDERLFKTLHSSLALMLPAYRHSTVTATWSGLVRRHLLYGTSSGLLITAVLHTLALDNPGYQSLSAFAFQIRPAASLVRQVCIRRTGTNLRSERQNSSASSEIST